MDELEEKMQGQVSKVANDLDMEVGKTLKFESNQQYGYFFRITLKEEKILRNKKNYTVIDSNKSGVRFRNSKLTEINEEYLEARNKYMSQQKSVVSEIIGIAGAFVIFLLSRKFIPLNEVEIVEIIEYGFLI